MSAPEVDWPAFIAWLRQQIAADRSWAAAASVPYRYALPGAEAPAGGVHWRWVTGDRWKTVVPDPALDEFVTEVGNTCWLVTVEEWPADHRPMPNCYTDSVVEMDSAAGGHIIRWDPARALAECAFLEKVLDAYEEAQAPPSSPEGTVMRDLALASSTARRCLIGPIVQSMALLYVGRPGYRPEWSPS